MTFEMIERPDPLKVQVLVICVEHGGDVIGKNIYGILSGSLCETDCEWCHSLITRIHSRVGLVYRP